MTPCNIANGRIHRSVDGIYRGLASLQLPPAIIFDETMYKQKKLCQQFVSRKPRASNRSRKSWWLTTVFQIRSGSLFPVEERWWKVNQNVPSFSMSNEKRAPGCLGYI